MDLAVAAIPELVLIGSALAHAVFVFSRRAVHVAVADVRVEDASRARLTLAQCRVGAGAATAVAALNIR